MITYFFSWFILLAAAFLNATIREVTYRKLLGDAANNASVFTGMILIGACIWFISKKWPFASARQAWQTGGLWVVMTEIFEFSMVAIWQGKGAAFFIQMHNIAAGELWPLLLIWILAAPYLCYRMR